MICLEIEKYIENQFVFVFIAFFMDFFFRFLFLTFWNEFGLEILFIFVNKINQFFVFCFVFMIFLILDIFKKCK